MGAEADAKKAWCEAAIKQITGELGEFLAPPVNAQNKEEVLKGVQSWIVKERRALAKEA